MRSIFPGSARAAYYDRNAIRISTVGFLTAGAAPHVATTRATYTVPANRKAFITQSSLDMIRITAAAPAAKQYITFFIVGESGDFEVTMLDNTVGASRNKTGGSGAVLFAGDVVQIKTFDGSTGGTADYDGQIEIIEFDA